MSRHDSGCLVVVWCRDQGFGSRQGRFYGKSRGWSRHRFEVEIWPVEIGCHDLGCGSRRWQAQQTQLRTRPSAHARTTCLLCAQERPRPRHYARSVRATWVLGVRTVHPTQFCDSALFRVTVWTLFMDTVHEHCS